MQTRKKIGPGHIVAMFVLGMFGFGLLIFTAMGNLALLIRVYPDPQFVGFGLLALDGGVIIWTVVAFLTDKHSPHFGIVLIGLGVDALLSCTAFMYELAARTGTNLPVQLSVIYVIGFAVVFNVGAALVYKLVPYSGNLIPTYIDNGNLIPTYQQSGNLIPMYADSDDGRFLARTQVKEEPTMQPVSYAQTATIQKPGAGASTTMNRVNGSTKNGKTGVIARGSANATTYENGFSFDILTAEEQEPAIIPIEQLR